MLEAAIELIAERGLQGLSLRECARRIGVSHAAPYRHFADKRALLLAIARQGFTIFVEMGRAAMAAVADEDDPQARLDAYGVSYVRFAVDHPVHFRVMFSAELDEPSTIEALDDAVRCEQGAGDEAGAGAGAGASALADGDAGAFALLVEATQAVLGEDVDEAAGLVAALAAWSLPHGLAMLILDGRIPAEQVSTPGQVEALARTVIEQWRGPLARSGDGPPRRRKRSRSSR
nr:TetR/AcrR family transcriptional regulator [Pseudenhygromyxa sp. WMMC2535]